MHKQTKECLTYSDDGDDATKEKEAVTILVILTRIHNFDLKL